tara:strand:+ start:391 stop:2523 length:2133 start_codon:yes stop_codon:yes gene_type:complete
MAFLGGLLSGMSTSTMGFITGAAEEAQRQLNPEPVEMTDAEKLQMKFRYDTLGKEYEELTKVKDGMVGFGKKSDLVLTGPGGERLPYSEFQWNVSTIPGETVQEQAAKFKNYTQINDIAFSMLPIDEQNKLKLYSVNHSSQFAKLLNEDNDGRKKDLEYIPQWEKIIPEAPDWLINTLYTNQNNNNPEYNKNMIKEIPQLVLEKVSRADAIASTGYAVDTGEQLDTAQKEVDLRNTKATLEYNILSHHMFKNGGIEKGSEANLVLRHISQQQNFPEFFTAFTILSREYLTSEQHPEGQSFNVMPNLNYNTKRALFNEIVPVVYGAALDNTLGKDPLEMFHSNNIDLYTSMYRNEDIVNEIFPDSTGQYKVKGKITKKEVIDELDIDMDVYNKRGDAWNQYKGVHKLFMNEMLQPTAVGGKGLENIALGIDMGISLPNAVTNIIAKMNSVKISLLPGYLQDRIRNAVVQGEGLLSQNLTEAEREWLKNNQYEGDVSVLNGTSVNDAAAKGKNVLNSTNENLLASIARQRALSLEMTYLAAAVVQGEGGKAISDGDQKQFLKALSYGWWSTVAQRIAAAEGIYESLAMYGEVALGYKNANTPEELYGIREYESVADIEDYNSQSKNLIPAQKDPAFPKVTSEGEKSVFTKIKILGLDKTEPNIGKNITKDNLSTHRIRLIEMYKEGVLEDDLIKQLQMLEPDIFTVKETKDG